MKNILSKYSQIAKNPVLLCIQRTTVASVIHQNLPTFYLLLIKIDVKMDVMLF